MTIILRPPGRGNWHPVTVTFVTPADLFTYRVGDFFNLNGIRFRVSAIHP